MTEIIRHSREGHAIRRAGPSDLPQIAELHADAWGTDADGFVQRLEDLLVNPHPRFRGDEMTVVEADGRIVSAQHMTRHVWRYGTVSIPVAEIEMVATHPDFRHRGLVRSQTDVMERWASSDGIDLIVINGVPLVYSGLGFDLAFEKWGGPASVRPLWPYAPTPQRHVTIRQASHADATLIAETYDRATSDLLVGYHRNAEDWAYALERSRKNPWHRDILVIESAGVDVGFVSMRLQDGHAPEVDAMELADGWTSPETTRAILGSIHEHTGSDIVRFGWLGSHHPSRVASPGLFIDDPSARQGAWYIKTRDPVSLMSSLTPALEARIRTSELAGCSESFALRIDGGDGIRIVIEGGHVTVERWKPERLLDGDVKIPRGMLTKVVFGAAAVSDFGPLFPYEVMASDRATRLMSVLFPTGRSWVLPVY